VRCLICKKSERRTGSRQVICSNDVCRRARKQQNKRSRRETVQRIETLRKRKEAEFHTKGPKRTTESREIQVIEAQERLLYRINT